MQNEEGQESPEQTQPVPQPNSYPVQDGPDQQEQQEYNEQYQNQEQYNNQYGEEQEQEVYADEITGALVETRQNKKRAQDDARLLANRIALLKLEEKKAWKKIQETKKKADNVMNVRERNFEEKQRKIELREQREKEEEALHAQNSYFRNQTRQNIMENSQLHQIKQQEDARKVKEEQARNEQIIRRQKESDMMKNNNVKHMIKQQKMMAGQRKHMEKADMKQDQRNRLINSILEENAKRQEIEAKVAKLEASEHELIQRLQNTSAIQKQAYEDLETAFNGELSPDELENRLGMNQMNQSKMSTKSKGYK